MRDLEFLQNVQVSYKFKKVSCTKSQSTSVYDYGHPEYHTFDFSNEIGLVLGATTYTDGYGYLSSVIESINEDTGIVKVKVKNNADMRVSGTVHCTAQGIAAQDL